MQTIQRGQRLKLDTLTRDDRLRVGLAGRILGAALDFSCFGLDAAGKLADESYFIFYNQRRPPCGGIAMSGSTGNCAESFELVLGLVPPNIERLVFVMTIDGPGAMNACDGGLAQFGVTGQRAGKGDDPRPEVRQTLLKIIGVSEQELYDRLLAEFPDWLRAARAKHIIQ